MRRPICAFAFVFLNALLICAQANPELQQPGTILLEAGRVLDVQKGNYLKDVAVLIDGDRIKEIGPSAELQNRAAKGTTVIDLRGATILPGLIDCHTHLMARVPDTPNGYIVNLATKSQAYRALEGAGDARATLHAGFTTVRDVENEGSEYADVA